MTSRKMGSDAGSPRAHTHECRAHSDGRRQERRSVPQLQELPERETYRDERDGCEKGEPRPAGERLTERLESRQLTQEAGEAQDGRDHGEHASRTVRRNGERSGEFRPSRDSGILHGTVVG